MLAACPDGAAPELAAIAAAASVDLVWQGEGSLGSRMQRLIQRSVAAGQAAIVLGADTPDLPLPYVAAAAAALGRAGAVIGPSSDGGYYLIGAAGVCPPVFELDAEWGSREVLQETLVRLRRARVCVTALPAWRDVDDAEGLAQLSSRMAGGGCALTATRRVLAGLDLAG
ncbi:MAG: DUF2064 domain-containing protein [Deltaproteobacteria bacterium]|nr:MAG: DUF2064 domain-containing protein [Deltaproteobacteria bacterium]